MENKTNPIQYFKNNNDGKYFNFKYHKYFIDFDIIICTVVLLYKKIKHPQFQLDLVPTEAKQIKLTHVSTKY